MLLLVLLRFLFNREEGLGKLDAILAAAEERTLLAELVEVNEPTSENEEMEEPPVYNELESSDDEADEEVVEFCLGSDDDDCC